MVPRDKLLNAIRSQGYKFKRQTERIELWKKPGNTHRLEVRKNARHDVEYTKMLLRKAGMSKEKIETFIAECGNA